MITWVSLRSGIAASGTDRIDQTPAATDAATRRNTRNRFLAENSMMRSIMFVPRGHRARRRAELAFRIDEERAGRDDAFTGREPARDGDSVAEPLADLHLARFEISVAAID